MSDKESKSLSILDYLSVTVAALGSLGVIISVVMTGWEYEFSFLIGGLLTLLTSSYFVYKTIEKVSKDKQKSGAIWLSYVIAIFMYTLVNTFQPLKDLEENSVSTRFQFLRGSNTKTESEGDTGRIEYIQFQPPAKARKDINIIGITTESLEKLQGTWPLPWSYYADIIETFKDSNNILMFDIFFVDYKPGQTEEMAAALQKNRNVLFDYPMEVSAESKEAVLNLEKRIDILRKFQLKNVIDENDAGISWVKFPQPPIEPISELSAGLGFANVKKDESGLNRKMPLVVKVYNSGRDRETEYFPSIDLLIVCKYYGIDVQRDVEVNMGHYIKLSNIPKKIIREFNIKERKFEERDVMQVPNEKREVVIPIDWEGQMEINFVGGRYSFKQNEIFEVTNDWDAELLEANQISNKIFLVAMYYATGRGASKDSHLSPFGDMSGIEHHAHAINTILNQDFLATVPNWGIFLIYVALGVMIGFLQPRVKTHIGFAIMLTQLLLYVVATLYIFQTFNLITVLPSVTIEQIVVFVAIIGFRILTEEENVKYIRQTFSKFVSKDVVDELLKHPDNLALGGSKREITIFFSDVRGFTTISEQLGPEDLVKLLNEYLSAMTDIIIEYKGTIDKYMGDAIMAFWGAPVPLEDHAYYACVAALVQLDYLKVLQQKWAERNVPVIDIGCGLNSGPAVVGNMGSSHRMEYTCMGDTINLGSRLEGSNKMYTTNVIISEYTYEKVKDRVVARELDLVRVKGKTQPVRIYELLGITNPEDMEKMKRPLQKAAT
ncbi:adenylate/guanylate cyclase domain-containing protein [Leptospira harrisiae]|uniref:Adenylate/guanylate cyclase domain-containing protein n=1 Tax=Leptospira harrisiae TaxID=2023189 RepID=A0A2N0AHQ7_9LEPT|nr:adenylate/guanylate cyclase domain-containing protein [Leptospira harrisiae]PJZ83817.1 adenylate/guanylate cyclase domain-containing protein [Leptospira harrisiae]PKA07727.1 adenylate/guanylate cyclase domain-containing protein [Leptospira harrisiae]